MSPIGLASEDIAFIFPSGAGCFRVQIKIQAKVSVGSFQLITMKTQNNKLKSRLNSIRNVAPLKKKTRI